MTEKNRKRLIVFTRYPEPGKTKTRLIPALGKEGAAQLQKCMTEQMILRVRKLMAHENLDCEVRFEGGTRRLMKKWLGSDLSYRPQGKGDIGVRMEHSFDDSFKEKADKVVIIGTDCPLITSSIIKKAFDLLIPYDVVIGPAFDGGYYLIGLTQMTHTLFKDIEWGTDKVLKKTQEIIQQQGLHMALIDELQDIDRVQDLPVWEKAQKLTGQELISVIIPTLNEEDNIVSTIKSTQTMTCKDVEIIIVDGGSTDNTVELAQSTGVTVMSAPKGRARQMNAGAEKAKGDILVFLHADTILPQGYDYHISHIINRPDTALGAFRLGISAPGIILRIIEIIANARSHFLQMPYGDQALFVKKNLFKEIRGFDDLPIMEDFIFVKALHKHGRIVLTSLPVITSARRWIRIGPLHATFINWAIIVSYYLGVPPYNLARWYGRGNDD